MDEKTLKIDGMTCGHCVARVKKALEGVPNLAVVKVDIGSAQVGAEKPGLDAVLEAAIRALEEVGYAARTEK
ncbi:MAG: heavy-metal-associated domain-containing protein [Vicinamibacterales bacterium]|jgi:copper chaperone CopZ|nr:heavy-metal-associated domain-containing protein [Vicinamibacterales bacterium]